MLKPRNSDDTEHGSHDNGAEAEHSKFGGSVALVD